MLTKAFQLLSEASQTITDNPRVDLYPKGQMIVMRAIWQNGVVCVHGIMMLDLTLWNISDEDYLKNFIEKCNREYARYLETRQKESEPIHSSLPASDDISKMYVDHLVTDLQKRSVFEIVVFLSKYCGWDRIKRYMDNHITELGRKKHATESDSTQV